MNIHEYQAKKLLAECGAPILEGAVAYDPEQAFEIAKNIQTKLWVVKAQIHAGGRSKGGGVKLARSPEEVRQYARDIIGMTLVTPQTGPDGQLVRFVYIESGCQIDRELYLSFLVDRSADQIAIVASTEGGVNIEEVVSQTPEKIFSFFIDPLMGLCEFQVRRISKMLDLQNEAQKEFMTLLRILYTFFVDSDASMLEINPLVVTGEGRMYPLDAKFEFDDNALFRHENIVSLRDCDEEDPTEVKARQLNLHYIKLDGNIGCMVNGAGLAMATMDIIQLSGGTPANFLDVGGGATKAHVTEAFKIILSDDNVEGVLVNIFGGIIHCDIVANGIIAAIQELGIDVPLVVRLEGAKAHKGKQLLENSGVPIVMANDLGAAAEKIVYAVTKEKNNVDIS